MVQAIVGGQLTTEQSFLLIVLIVVLANYQKNEANNIYLHHLKHMDDPVVLKVYNRFEMLLLPLCCCVVSMLII